MGPRCPAGPRARHKEEAPPKAIRGSARHPDQITAYPGRDGR